MAVERSGQLGSQMGLKRENSGEPSMAKRRTSFSIDEEEHPEIRVDRKQSIASEFDARKNSTVIEETIPEAAVETPLKEANKRLGGDTTTTKSSGSGMSPKTAAASNVASYGHTNRSSKAATTAKIVKKPSSSRFSGRPAPISTAKSSTVPNPSPKTTKSPAAPKTPTTPRGRPKEPVKQLEKKPENKEITPAASNHTSKPASKPAPSSTSTAAPKTRIPPSPPQTGFVKPKPRSPTRPIKLPASLTAHTASSGSKSAAALTLSTSSRRSTSRASGNSQTANQLQTQPTLSRSPSRVSTATAPKPSTRRPSTLHKAHSRPSLGPPPSNLKKKPSRQSLPPSAPADEGFLTRMMRPTTSSASKTAEKVTTPPKRPQSVKRPVTRDGPPRYEASKAAAPKMGKLVANPAAEESKPATDSSVPEMVKEELKPALAEKSEPNITEAPLAAAAHAEAAETKENTTQVSNAHESNAEEEKTEEDVSTGDESTPAAKNIAAVLEKTPEGEFTADKPAPTDKLVPAAREPANEEKTSVATESVVPEAEEEAPQKTEDGEVVKEAIEISELESERLPEIAAEVDTPKEIEIKEDPEDVKAREEIAKHNAEVMKAPAEDDDVE